MARNFRITGTRRLQRNLARAGGLAQRGLEAGLVREANAIMTESKRQTPVDTGRLRASGTVMPPESRGSGVSIEMGYGTRYAIFVHEIMTAHHPVGNAKFLERPLLAAEKGMADRLATAVAAAWRGL